MAQDPYDPLMSLALDGLLNDEDLQDFQLQLEIDEERADAWTRMQTVDSLLQRQIMVAPAVDFTADVMARVEQYESQKRWYPILIGILTVLSLIGAASLILPLLVFTQGWYRLALEWPIVGSALIVAAQVFDVLLQGATFSTHVMLNWIRFLTSDPIMLGTVVTALAIASIWIGLREASRLTLISLDMQQA